MTSLDVQAWAVVPVPDAPDPPDEVALDPGVPVVVLVVDGEGPAALGELVALVCEPATSSEPLEQPAATTDPAARTAPRVRDRRAREDRCERGVLITRLCLVNRRMSCATARQIPNTSTRADVRLAGAGPQR
ncbi:hypothetical protein BN12_3070006 [Nostocoides japonicum T1-X7]|uniref:Uncharacterized protein n=1 Tax=Nostocoides japonicum T1-X7 TaxID=1194083 RepID=A0A077M0F9_9MICO|nr:hypothetical protein BN12_3070006 [Tetrasphaera japonica T1-X7]